MAPLSRLLSLTVLAGTLANAIDIRMGVRSTHHIDREIFSLSTRHDTDPALLYKAHNLSVPIDHFHNETKYEPHSNGTFPLRYWFDASHYKQGGPVIVLQSGETSGENRLSFLQKGVLAQMARATNGIAVVIEHRYYGTSWPVPDLTTKNFRFLTTAQALADEAYFASNVQFPGLEKYGDLTAKTTPYFGYGGSYAGAFNALLRVQYPDVFWGTFSSSGVTKAIWDYWAYWVPIAEKAPQNCVASQRALVSFIDGILINNKNPSVELKTVFGMEHVTHDDDFASAVTVTPLGSWQALNWDPAQSSPQFYNYCDNITASGVLYPETESKRAMVEKLIQASACETNNTSVNSILNAIGYNNLTQVSQAAAGGFTQDEYFGSSHNVTYNSLTSIADASFKSWPYQYCTEWGYLQTGNTPPEFGLPLVSRTCDIEYNSLICKLAFNITSPPDVEVINKYGAFDISYPRLAMIDGDWDPWKPATPHAFQFGAKNRSSTMSEPFVLISEAVHHWDENGLFKNETTDKFPPERIVETQRHEIEALKSWMLEWKLAKANWHQDV